MWFKQLQLFQLTDSLSTLKNDFVEKLTHLAFRPCLPSMPVSVGWVSPVDEDEAPLVQFMKDNIMLCLQVEEKILPAIVVRQELLKKIKKIQTEEDRKVYQKEKEAMKDEIIINLLPQAFTKLTRVYGYIDTVNNWLVLGTTNTKKTEQFISLLKKSLSEHIHPFALQKLSTIITHWLKKQDHPSSLAIEKACVLQDPNQQHRVIRCQHQDLFATGIQAFIKEGCEVKQLAMSWYDKVQFVLTDHFLLNNIKFKEDVLGESGGDAATKLQQANVDFLIMSDVLTGLLKDLLNIFLDTSKLLQSDSSSSETKMKLGVE